jgi:thiol-disulfide isomerase/thioredoxin
VSPASAVERATLILYGRTYCHLCDDMRVAVQPLVERFGATLIEVDVDSDPRLEECYGERVPVLVAGGCELCHYFLDTDRVRAYLEEFR